MGVASQIADNTHRNFLIQRSLNRRGQSNAFNSEVFQCQTQLGKFRAKQFADFLRQQNLVRRHIQEWDTGAAERGRQLGDCDIAQLVFQVYAAVLRRHTTDFFKEFCRIADAVRIHTERTQLHRAKLSIAHGNWLRRTPFSCELLFGIEKVNIRFKRRLKKLVPVFQVGQHWQSLRIERVTPRTEHVRGYAFIDKHRHLRLTHSQACTVLDLLIGNRKTPHQQAVIGIRPLNDVDKLFLDKVEHRSSLFEEERITYGQSGQFA